VLRVPGFALGVGGSFSKPPHLPSVFQNPHGFLFFIAPRCSCLLPFFSTLPGLFAFFFFRVPSKQSRPPIPPRPAFDLRAGPLLLTGAQLFSRAAGSIVWLRPNGLRLFFDFLVSFHLPCPPSSTLFTNDPSGV